MYSFPSPSLTPMRASSTAHLILGNSAFLIMFQAKYNYIAIHYVFFPHPLTASVCQEQDSSLTVRFQVL